MAQVTAGAEVVDAEGKTTREINARLKELIAAGAEEIRVLHPAGRHSLAVALEGDVRIVFDGPVGWYCGGMNSGPEIHVLGNCGWGLAECQMGGRVTVEGNGGSGVGASIRGGFVLVRGHCGARAGISMKGGILVVGGDVGYNSGFMMQRGTMIVCGDAAEGLGDSMYEGAIFVAGRIAALGADAVEAEVTEEDRALLDGTLTEARLDGSVSSFRKIVSGRKLWNFSTKEPELWRAAL